MYGETGTEQKGGEATVSLPLIDESLAESVSEQPAFSDRTAVETESVDFFNLSREKLERMLANEFSLSAYRAEQLFDWVYRKSVTDVRLMTNISKNWRELLFRRFSFRRAVVRDLQVSRDGTRKYLIEVSPGVLVESVLIEQTRRRTLCVSSQFGCGMGCEFCRTATMGFRGNLSAGDIVRQLLAVCDDVGRESFSNVVFMGMGEPLHNTDSVIEAVRILQDNRAFEIGSGKITVSTVGLIPGIRKFSKSGLGVNLAVSLNATTNALRDKLMPVNRKFPIEDLLRCLKEYPLTRKKRITVGYVLLAGVNDSTADMRRLIRLLHGLKVKVNLIPYNENAGLGFRAPARARVSEWLACLTNAGLRATVRWSKGEDIDAACGQLIANRSVE